MDELSNLALEYSEKAVGIGGTDITPRSHYVRVLIWEMRSHDSAAIRKELDNILDLSFRYGDEITYKLANKKARELDELAHRQKMRIAAAAVVGLMTLGLAGGRRCKLM